MNPSGVQVASFKVPTEEERAHDFLWRIHRQTPRLGEIGVFNRSHYEDVLVVRVHDLVPEKVWRPRYKHIRAFEQNLLDGSTTIVKLYLHISKDEQRERLQARVDDPEKHWKFRTADLEERKLWDDYRKAFEEAISETSTRHAPWYVVPADHKWYRNWAVLRILTETLEAMDPAVPEARGRPVRRCGRMSRASSSATGTRTGRGAGRGEVAGRSVAGRRSPVSARRGCGRAGRSRR